MTNPFNAVRQFVIEVLVELKRSSWPTRKELMGSTLVVMVAMVALGLFVAFADYVFLKVVGLLTGAV